MHPIAPRSGPGAHQAHQDGAEQDQEARKGTLPAAHDNPAVVAEEVLREELDQRRENQKAG